MKIGRVMRMEWQLPGGLEVVAADDQVQKQLDIAEFRARGYLQEVNRQFFHPLGLALCVDVDAALGTERIGGIIDYRDDPEGVYFADDTLDPEKARRVGAEKTTRSVDRERILGYQRQPIPLDEDDAGQ